MKSILLHFTYDPIGNLLTKSDVGNYAYPAPGQPFPHAVSSISGSVINTTFSYDANGNMTSGNGLAITYTGFNMPKSITRGSNQIVFFHDSTHGRIKQAGATGETLYLNCTGVMSERLGRHHAMDRLSLRRRRDDRHARGAFGQRQGTGWICL